MKILFIGDYSNLHATLAGEFRRRGHHVTVVSDGCGHMDVKSDIFLERDRGLFNGVRYLYRLFQILPRLRGYDVVQMINPHFFSLKPGKLRYFLKELKQHNGKVFLSLAGNDGLFVKRCVEGNLFRFSEFRVGNERTEFACRNGAHERGYMTGMVQTYTDDFYNQIDGGMAVLPEYYMAARDVLGDRLCFTNLPIDLDELRVSEMPSGDKVRILVGMRSLSVLSKGTARLLELAQRVEKRLPERVEVVNVRDLPWSEYKEVLRGCHINLDQLYSYSPAMNALSSMALGRVAGSGAEPEYYDMIGEKELRPVLRVSPLVDDLEEQLCALAIDCDRLNEMGHQSRRLVEKHNSVALVADRYMAHWENIINR